MVMMTFLLVMFCLVCFVMLLLNSNLLLLLILLEINGFLVLCSFGFLGWIHSLDTLFLLFFSVLVMEGVLAISILVNLVSASGLDYLAIKCLAM